MQRTWSYFPNHFRSTLHWEAYPLDCQGSPYEACVCISHSVMSDSLWPHRLQPNRLLCPWDSPGQEYWSRLPFPSPGVLPNPGIEPWSPALRADSLPSQPPGKPNCLLFSNWLKYDLVSINTTRLICSVRTEVRFSLFPGPLQSSAQSSHFRKSYWLIFKLIITILH